MNAIINKTVAFFFCFYIILAAYPVTNSLYLGDIIMMILTSLLIVKKRKLVICNELGLFLGYVVLQTLFLQLLSKPYILFRPSIVRLIHTIILFVISSCVSIYCDKKYFFKIYTAFSCLCMAAVFFQFVQVWVLHKPMSILIPFPQNVSKDYELLNSIMRPSAFFLEPQHFASFIIPLLVINLLNGKIMFSALITFCIIMSTSTLGVILSAVVWFLYFLAYGEISKGKKLLSCLVVLFFITLGVQTGAFVGAINKIESGTFNDNIRIFRAYEVYMDMPLIDQITGIGTKNVNAYLSSAGVAPQWLYSDLSRVRNFISSFFGNFIEFGFLGGLLYLWMLVRMFKKSKFAGKVITISILVSSFAVSMTYNVWFLFYFCLYRFVKDEDYLPPMEEQKKWLRLVF